MLPSPGQRAAAGPGQLRAPARRGAGLVDELLGPPRTSGCSSPAGSRCRCRGARPAGAAARAAAGRTAACRWTQLRQNEAVSLFVERAAPATGAFELTAATHAAVAEVCRRLDGLPLAIELAAVRTRVLLAAEQILDRLSDRFALLTGGGRAALPRQQTLRTTIDWSHDLLNAAEQRLLRRLCVFAGRFTLDDVEAVCVWDDDSGPVLDLLSSLVDKSLVTREDLGGIACFRLHETMRAYAAGKARATPPRRTRWTTGSSSTTGPGRWSPRATSGTARSPGCPGSGWRSTTSLSRCRNA